MFNFFFGNRLGGKRRHKDWRKVRGEFLKKQNVCQVCLKKAKQVHHIIPFHINIELELERDNLMTFCRVHHFWFGHLGSWHSWNENIVEDARIMREKILNRP